MNNTRYVRKGSGGGWEILKEGHLRATAHGATKGAAVKAARSAVRREGGGEVLVMNRTGKVVEADTVARPKRRSAA
jgi:uncharacterized protein DUF2188